MGIVMKKHRVRLIGHGFIECTCGWYYYREMADKEEIWERYYEHKRSKAH
jgi:hypothetical protein